MDEEAIQKWRQTRMKDLAKKIGGNAALGRKLGYQDGAFVGQMIGGVRPITEKTVLAAEALSGCAGWFAYPASSANRPSVFEALTESERAILNDLRVLPDEDREEFARAIHASASKTRAFLGKVLKELTAGKPSLKASDLEQYIIGYVEGGPHVGNEDQGIRKQGNGHSVA